MTAQADVPFTGQQALRMAVAGLDYLKSPRVARELGVAGCGEMLRGLAGIDSKVIAARASLAGVFAAGRGFEADGYGGLTAWLVNVTKVTKAAARDTAAWVRRAREHPVMAEALGDGQLSESWMRKISVWVGKLPEDGRQAAEEILVRAALAGVGLGELQVLAAEMYERSRTTPDKDPGDDGDEDGFEDRYLAMGTTFGGAARLSGDLTPQCASALQAVLDALGKRRGGQDTRSIGQRYHDALEEAARLLIRADMVPGRAGQDTQVQLHIPFSTLRGMDGASVIEQAWLAARAGHPDYITGLAAEAAACDATLITVVTGHPDWAVVDQIIELALGSTGVRERSRALTAEEWRALRYAIARLAMDFCSGPAGIAAMLRAGLLQMPYAAKSLPLDVGCADSIPPHIRRAVMLRDRHCQFPSGCWVPGAQCHVHHLVHKSRGGRTSIKNCVLLCSYHHQVMVHRMGWELTLQADGTTEAKGPDGQIVRSHSPPPRPG